MRTDSDALIFMAEKYSIVHMYDCSFIHSSVNGHLGWFHVLAVVNSAAGDTGYMCLFQLQFPSGYMPSSGNVGSRGRFIPSF